MSGKILVQNLKPLIIGRGSFLGAALTQKFVQNKCQPLTIDKKEPAKLFDNEKFIKMNVADSSLFDKYLSQMPKIDAVINLAAVTKSYNYYLSYLISKSVLEKFRNNDVNEFGCRGVIVNLIQLASNYDDEYFSAQNSFAKQYEIDDNKIDDQVYELADQLTANRIRCNTVMVNDKVSPNEFADLMTHIVEDQYIAGQVINMEDDLVSEPPTYDEVVGEIHKYPSKKKIRPDEVYKPPVHKL